VEGNCALGRVVAMPQATIWAKVVREIGEVSAGTSVKKWATKVS
jgi:hypothetical protein